MSILLGVIAVILIISFLIIAHEFGHFIVARLFGVRVDEFGIGFPPRAIRFGKLGDTEYTLNWIPLGGFVKLFGEADDESERGRGSLMDAPRWKQACILVAGVAMNVVVAYGLFAAGLAIGVPAVVDQLQPGGDTKLYVSDVIPNSPADAAGIEQGDQILSMQDAQGNQPAALTPSAAVAFVSDHGGQPLTVTYIQNNATTTTSVIPANSVDPQNAGRPAIGIGLVLVANVALPPLQALQQSFYTTGGVFTLTIEETWGVISTAIHGSPNLSDVSGPIGLYWVVGDASRAGLGILIETIGLISVSLAIINLVPIPILDGGRLAVLLIEGVMRKRAPRLAIQLLDAIGLGLIMLLVVVVCYHDVITHLS